MLLAKFSVQMQFKLWMRVTETQNHFMKQVVKLPKEKHVMKAYTLFNEIPSQLMRFKAIRLHLKGEGRVEGDNSVSC